MVKKKRSSSSQRAKRRTKRKAHHQTDLHVAEGVAKDVVRFLEAAVVSAIMPDMKRFTKEAVHAGQDIIYQTQEVMLTRLYALAMLGAGGVVLIVGLVYIAEVYFSIQRAWSLLVIGLLLIAGSHILQTRIGHRRHYLFK